MRNTMKALLIIVALSLALESNAAFLPAQKVAVSPHRSTSISPSPRTVVVNLPKQNSQQPVRPEESRTELQSSATKSSDETSFRLPAWDEKTRTSLASAAAFVVLDVVFRRVFLKYQIGFPSSLAGCSCLFAALLALPSQMATNLFEKLSPGALLLAKWLPLFFVPSLVTLPLAQSMGSAAELLKVGLVIVGGFYFTLLTTAWSVLGVRKLLSTSTTDAETDDELTTEDEPPAKPAPKAFSDETFNALTVLSSTSGVAALATTKLGSSVLAGPLTALFLLSSTLQTFVFGARLPKKFTKLVHPLVTCTTLSWAVCAAFAAATGRTFRSMLRSYRTGSLGPTTAGPGDVLLFLLGPAVVSLAISMYDRRKLMRENLAEVGTSVGVATAGGVFGTAAVVRLLAISNPSLRLSLVSRNITSPLAMAIASILGADVSLAVSFVVVTGLIGANFGASILDAVGIKDAVARGLGIGASAHGLGTAAFAGEKDAFPFAAIAMALTATAATVTCSIPILKRFILQLALGGP